VVRAWLRAQAYQLFTRHQVSGMRDGTQPGARSSLNKLYWSELDIALHETAQEVLGPEAALEQAWSKGFLFALSGPIYAGTNEIQRTIVAERVLGLPKGS
jgi:alkylation response protein AidB-like acyl-CoA dehydrogenase